MITQDNVLQMVDSAIRATAVPAKKLITRDWPYGVPAYNEYCREHVLDPSCPDSADSFHDDYDMDGYDGICSCCGYVANEEMEPCATVTMVPFGDRMTKVVTRESLGSECCNERLCYPSGKMK